MAGTKQVQCYNMAERGSVSAQAEAAVMDLCAYRANSFFRISYPLTATQYRPECAALVTSLGNFWLQTSTYEVHGHMPRVWRALPTVWSPVQTKRLQDLIEGR